MRVVALNRTKFGDQSLHYNFVRENGTEIAGNQKVEWLSLAVVLRIVEVYADVSVVVIRNSFVCFHYFGHFCNVEGELVKEI